MVILKKIKGSTLIEVIVSLTITMIVFAIAMQIFVSVFRSENYYNKLHAFLAIKKIEAECKKNNKYYDEKILLDDLDIFKSIIPYNGSKDIQILLLEAFDKKGKKLVEHKELIYFY